MIPDNNIIKERSLKEALRAETLKLKGNLDLEQRCFLFGVEFALTWLWGGRTISPTTYAVRPSRSLHRVMHEVPNDTDATEEEGDAHEVDPA